MITINQLLEADKATKGADYNDEWRRAACYYTDQSRALTRASLKKLGLGIPHDPRPLEVGLLPRTIERLACVYDRPPTRWLARDRARLAEDDPELARMLDLYERMGMDAKLREADRQTALYRQVLIRVYPVDSLKLPVIRLYGPQCVARMPSDSTPDILAEDAAFALLQSGEPRSPSAKWELWERTSSGWVMRTVDGNSTDLAEPFPLAYGILPAMMRYESDPCGQAWLPPRASRTAYVEKLSQAANDLAALVQAQAHDQRVVATKRPEDVPQEGGPGSTWVLPPDSQASVLTANPKIAESVAVMEAQLRLYVLSESLPLSEFDAQAPALTGAALRVQQRALHDRRAAQVPSAVADERRLWEIVRAVHNAHAREWGVDPLDVTTRLEADIGDVEVPVDPREQQEAAARGIALGTMSVIDAIQAQHRCSRAQAIEVFRRVQADARDYPPAISAAGAVQSGPRLAGVDAGKGGASGDVAPSVLPDRADLRGKASVIQAIEEMGG